MAPATTSSLASVFGDQMLLVSTSSHHVLLEAPASRAACMAHCADL